MNLPDLNDVRRDVEKIRRVVSIGESITKAELARLQRRDYDDAIARVNEELLACEALIDDDNASLAVQRAERTSILELTAALDFSDREAWADFVEEQQLPRPPKPLSATARRLGRAIGPARQREPLLRTIRWHALAGSPLSVRLEAMRRMQEVDETPEIWEKDILTFEKVRLQEITEEVEEANQKADVPRLRTLLNELRNDRWLVELPEDLIPSTGANLSRHRARAASRRIPKVLEQMRNAESVGIDGISEGRRLREQLNRLLDVARLKPESDLAVQAAEAVLWLNVIDEEEQREADYEQLIRQLEHGLDNGAELDVLQSLHYQLQQFEGDVPESLAIRLQNVVADKEVSDRRRHSSRIVLSVAAVTTVALLLFWFFTARSERLELEDHERRLAVLLERRDLPGAEEYVNTLQEQLPDATVHPPIAALIAQLSELTDAEVQRRERFAAGVEELRDSIPDASTMERAVDLERRLSEVEAQSDRRPSESEQILKLDDMLTSRRDEIQTTIDNAYSEEAKAMAQRRDSVDNRDIEALRELLSDFHTLADRPYVSEELKRSVLQIVLNLEDRLSLAVEMEAQDRMARSITQALGDPAAFRKMLTDYESQFPQDPRSVDFERICREEFETWNQVILQNELMSRWSALDPDTLSPKLAAELLQDADDILSNRQDLLLNPAFSRLVDYVRSVAARRNEFGADIAVEEITRHFKSTDWYEGLYMILAIDENQNQEEKRHYSEDPPRPDGRGWRINAVLSELELGKDQAAQQEKFETIDIQLPDPNPKGDDWLAPQVTFARHADRRLREMTDATWEKTLLGLLEDLNQQDAKRMEPITRFDLTLMILEILSEGSSVARQHFADYIRKLKILPNETRHNVFDPEDDVARRMRPEIREVLQDAPDFSEALEDILKRRTVVFESPLSDIYQWVGWLRRDEDNVWRCEAQRPPPQSLNGTLWTAVPLEKEIQFLPIGRAENGAYIIDVSPVGFAQGRPLYVNVPADPKLARP